MAYILYLCLRRIIDSHDSSPRMVRHHRRLHIRRLDPPRWVGLHGIKGRGNLVAQPLLNRIFAVTQGVNGSLHHGTGIGVITPRHQFINKPPQMVRHRYGSHPRRSRRLFTGGVSHASDKPANALPLSRLVCHPIRVRGKGRVGRIMDNTTHQNTPPLCSGKANSDPKAPTFKIGLLKDKLGTAPDFREPTDLEELKRWEAED